VDGGQSAGSGSLLAELLLSGFLSEHSSLGDEDDVSVRELLLEFTGESEGGKSEYDQFRVSRIEEVNLKRSSVNSTLHDLPSSGGIPSHSYEHDMEEVILKRISVYPI
jgi:hypothetical protein